MLNHRRILGRSNLLEISDMYRSTSTRCSIIEFWSIIKILDKLKMPRLLPRPQYNEIWHSSKWPHRFEKKFQMPSLTAIGDSNKSAWLVNLNCRPRLSWMSGLINPLNTSTVDKLTLSSSVVYLSRMTFLNSSKHYSVISPEKTLENWSPLSLLIIKWRNNFWIKRRNEAWGVQQKENILGVYKE